jgi:hypothetical protein
VVYNCIREEKEITMPYKKGKVKPYESKTKTPMKPKKKPMKKKKK